MCATCTGSGDSALAGRRFRCVVLDEASQATEPATLVPLTQGAEVCVGGSAPPLKPGRARVWVCLPAASEQTIAACMLRLGRRHACPRLPPSHAKP